MHKQSEKLLILLLGSWFALTAANAADQAQAELPAKPTDFAYAVPLQFEGQDALYQAALPLSIYQHTVRSDLGDLRVFNAQGEVVPHMLQLPARSNSEPEISELVFFPLQGPANSGLDQLSVSIKRNIAGTLIDISSNAKPTASAKLSGYLLDASALNQAIQALELEWAQGKENFVSSLHIESSDDLQHWTTITRNAPLASMQFGGHSLLQKRVELPAVHAKYLRLSWPSTQSPLLLSKITAEISGVAIEAPLGWQNSKGIAVTDKPGEYQFDLGAHLPIQRIRIALPQMNTLVQAALFSRANAEQSWQAVNNATLYKLNHAGQDINNPDLKLNSQHRYWLLRVAQNSGGLGEGLPEMQAGWQAHQLQFVTRGNPPFQLAYGNRESKPAVFDMQNLLKLATQDEVELSIATAQTGAQITLGGEARVQPPAPPLPWKKWLLWAILSSAVLLLGVMAYSLLKKMERHEKNKIKR